MQQRAGAHLAHVNRKTLFRGAARQFLGYPGHEQRMPLDIGQHGIFFPQGKTGLIIRRGNRRGASQAQRARLRQAGQRTTRRAVAVGAYGIKTVHRLSMPLPNTEGKISEGAGRQDHNVRQRCTRT